MRTLKYIFTGVLLPALLLSNSCSATAASPWQPPLKPQRLPLLIVIFDGFRHDYMELYRSKFGIRLPNFESFTGSGVRAKLVKNVYPTETLPNHQSLVTGLYADSHGFVMNTFLDSQLPSAGVFSIFNQSSLNDPAWTLGWPEPIWVTNQRQGGRSAVVLYPNSDVPFNDVLPFVQVDEYSLLNSASNSRYPYSRRVDRILHWLGNPDQYNINLALLYFDEPDHTAHQTGHLSREVADRLLELDFQLGRLLNGLDSLKILDKVNIVLTADHGMTTGNTSNLIDLDSIVNPAWYDNYLADKANIHFSLWPKPGRTADILKAVSDAKLPYLFASQPANLPQWMHFNNSRRISPVFLYTKAPYVIVVGGLPSNPPARFGVHGYFNNDTDMWPLWLARGPAFRSGGAVVDGQFQSVDLYPLACKLLGLEANPNNGSLDRIASVLSSPDWLQLNTIQNDSLLLYNRIMKWKCHFLRVHQQDGDVDPVYFVALGIVIMLVVVVFLLSFLVQHWRWQYLKLRVAFEAKRASAIL